MKIKISITLSEQLVQEIDEFVSSDLNRSTFLETAAWEYIAKLRRAHDACDLAILNKHADYFNQEMADVLSSQIL